MQNNNRVQMRIGFIILGIMIIFMLTGLLNPYSFETMNTDMILAKPSISHLFGCDEFGRDLLKRTQTGMGISVLISVSAVFIGTVIGTVIGALCGYFGGIIDEILSGITDVLFAIPSILLALVFVSLFGSGTLLVILALGISIVPSFAKMMRAEFRKQKEMEYVKLARILHIPTGRILFVHILPNVTDTFLNCIFIAFNNTILAEAGLSFLGIGVQPPLASLGTLLSDAGGYIRTAPHLSILPSLALVLLLLGMGLISSGDTFHNAFSKQFKN